MNAAETEGTPI